ncbi:hypothetical protein [Pseudomonas sp. NPDC089758]|uniref:hypothetical protein n=1 Tax=Pseudomonas sp. NPDC089758 TaxID=3364473 RepID=UPI003823B803
MDDKHRAHLLRGQQAVGLRVVCAQFRQREFRIAENSEVLIAFFQSNKLAALIEEQRFCSWLKSLPC